MLGCSGVAFHGRACDAVPHAHAGAWLCLHGRARAHSLGRDQHRDEAWSIIRSGCVLHLVLLLLRLDHCPPSRRRSPSREVDHWAQHCNILEKLGEPLRQRKQLWNHVGPVLSMLHWYPQWREPRGRAERPSEAHPAGDLCSHLLQLCHVCVPVHSLGQCCRLQVPPGHDRRHPRRGGPWPRGRREHRLEPIPVFRLHRDHHRLAQSVLAVPHCSAEAASANRAR
mmetsp:Transcript_157130/g.501067  ORF Transcript_157130/g.501067 Transcript_157130/m.501067 type:complete len:225 (+) Transcript_157130:593-1267(+)